MSPVSFSWLAWLEVYQSNGCFKEPVFILLIFFCCLPALNFTDFYSNFIISFFLLVFGLNWKHMGLMLQVSLYVLLLLHPTHFAKLYFHLVQNTSYVSLEMSSLTCVLFSTVLFNFQILWDFLDVILLLISMLIQLRSENVLCMISILLYLLRCVSWLQMYSILVNFSY